MSGGKGNKKHRAEIAAADKTPLTASFSTEHGSQGVTNPRFAEYVRMHPDLMANYNKHWKKGAPEPLSQNNAGISLAEFGAMHWGGHGKNNPKRLFPGQTSSDGDGGGSGRGSLLDQSWSRNVHFPMLVPDYTVPQYSAMTNPWTGQNIDASYMPWTEQGLLNVPEEVRHYEPPELMLTHPKYITNPTGLLELPEDWEDLLDMDEEEEDDDDENPTDGPRGTEGEPPHG